MDRAGAVGQLTVQRVGMPAAQSAADTRPRSVKLISFPVENKPVKFEKPASKEKWVGTLQLKPGDLGSTVN